MKKPVVKSPQSAASGSIQPAGTATVSSTGVAAQLAAIEKGLVSIVSLTTKTRRQLENRSANVPDALVTQVAGIAAKSGGVVAGMPLDVNAALAILQDVKDARAAATAARQIAQQMDDYATQQRVVVSDRVFAIYRALGRLVKTPEGNSLLRAYEEMVTTVKNRPRKTRKKKPVAVTSGAPTPEPTPPPAAPAPTVTNGAPAAPHS
jgi:hypothetical protein